MRIKNLRGGAVRSDLKKRNFLRNGRLRVNITCLKNSSDFDYYTTLPHEQNGILMITASEEKMEFKVISGAGFTHYTNNIIKKTAV